MFRYLVLLLSALALAVAVWLGLGARYSYHLTSSRQIRVERLTGKVQVWSLDSGSWVPFKRTDPLDKLLTP